MHCSSVEKDGEPGDGDVLVAIATMVTEGRIPGKLNSQSRGFYEGPHCPTAKSAQEHKCDANENLCKKYNGFRNKILKLWQKGIPTLCVEVLLVAACACEDKNDGACTPLDQKNGLLLEQWCLDISHRRPKDVVTFTLTQLLYAIRSQLYFSQLSAWLSTEEKKLHSRNLHYRITIPGETFEASKFTITANKHQFPKTDIGKGYVVNVLFLSLPRIATETVPVVGCLNCGGEEEEDGILDDRMHTMCTLKGKHCCEEILEDYGSRNTKTASTSKPKPKLLLNILNSKSGENTTRIQQQNIINFTYNQNDLNKEKDKGQILLDAIIRSGRQKNPGADAGAKPLDLSNQSANEENASDSTQCDNKSERDNFSIRDKTKYKVYLDYNCDRNLSISKYEELREISDIEFLRGLTSWQKKQLRKESDDKDNVPTASEQAKFRKNLDSAASMVFHARTGLPLTSSPAPVRRGKSCFDFDSSINSVSAIKSALFSSSFSTDDDSESDGSAVSPCSPETSNPTVREINPVKFRRKGNANNLLGSFEESVLNGRLEPVSTVHGFRAELGASGSFVPKHLVVPVTVFFYTLGDNDKVSSPYLGHINLGKKGYNVPKCGTIQVTLFNPLGTVVKMFVIMYNLSDMPPNSQTFIRQRTFYMPTNCKEESVESSPEWLRFLIHLRFMSSKSGRIYLHSDIRMIIFRKSDQDTATAHGRDMSYELRSFTHMPSNPRFSSRK